MCNGSRCSINSHISRSMGFVMVAALCLAMVCVAQQPAAKPTPVEGDYVSHDFHFKTGETLPELRLHYMTFGKAERDSSGKVTNAVLILHGTGGSGRQFLAPQFAEPGTAVSSWLRSLRTCCLGPANCSIPAAIS